MDGKFKGKKGSFDFRCKNTHTHKERSTLGLTTTEEKVFKRFSAGLKKTSKIETNQRYLVRTSVLMSNKISLTLSANRD